MTARRTAALFGVAGIICASLLGVVLWPTSSGTTVEDSEVLSEYETQVSIQLGVIEDIRTLDATVVREDERTIKAADYAREGAEISVVTALSAVQGDSIDEGEVLLEVNYRPIILLQGSIPAIRDLGPGDEGSDVTQLQETLTSLGFELSDTSGYYGTSTASAVESMYKSRGYEALERTPDGLAALSEAQKMAEQAVASANRDRETAGTTGDVDAISEADQQIEATQSSLASINEDLEAERSKAGPYVPRTEVFLMSSALPTVTQSSYQVGDELSEQDPVIMSLAGGSMMFEVSSVESELLASGEQVTVSAGGSTVDGSVVRIEERTTDPDRPTEIVAVVEAANSDSLDVGGGSVDVTVVVASSKDPVLNVPLDALVVNGEGNPAIWLLRDGTPELLSVTVGLVANGFVEVDAGGQIAEGDPVAVRGGSKP